MKNQNEHSANIFILTGEWTDRKGCNILRFIGTSKESGAVEVIITNNNPVFFIQRNFADLNLNVPYTRKEVKLKSFHKQDVDALYFNTQADLRKAADTLHQNGITTYESDIDPARRYLMERFINAQISNGQQYKEGKAYKFYKSCS
ncbi:MAG: hypothetical protein P8Y81_04280 [Ignavibacteriaceae bacterium]